MLGSKLTGANQRDGKGAGLGRETGGGGQGAVLVVRGRFLGAGVNDYTISDDLLLCLKPFLHILKERSKPSETT